MNNNSDHSHSLFGIAFCLGPDRLFPGLCSLLFLIVPRPALTLAVILSRPPKHTPPPLPSYPQRALHHLSPTYRPSQPLLYPEVASPYPLNPLLALRALTAPCTPPQTHLPPPPTLTLPKLHAMARSSRPPPPEEDDDEQQPSNVLQFNEPLSWKAGKPIPTGTLITRLKALSKELIALEQEAVDRDSLATPARELVAVALLQHKDNGVKAYAACCLADMLRLHAPDAPYTALQLKVCLFSCTR